MTITKISVRLLVAGLILSLLTAAIIDPMPALAILIGVVAGLAVTVGISWLLGKLFVQWRWLNQAYAYVFGYFWLPCPLCNRMFGGHEIGSVSFVEWNLDDGRGRVDRVCCRLHDPKPVRS